MISGRLDRRRRALAWSTLASAAIHLIVLTLIFYAVARLLVPRGEKKEIVAQTTTISIAQPATPRPVPARAIRHVRQRESAPARTQRHELVKEVAVKAPPQPARRPTVPTQIERDQSGFAKEVAQLNAQNDVHAIPTIDPGARESFSKSYSMDIPSSLRGEEHGNGIITPTKSWRDHGQDCYYGRYEFTYPDGATESGSIVWPFCYDPASDPFKEPPHQIPFPLPLTGFRLASDTDLPPIEKDVYERWAAANKNDGSVPQQRR